MASQTTGGIGAIGAGTSGGTLLVILAGQLPPESIWHSLLVYISPGVTMLVGAVWIFLSNLFSGVLEQRNAEIIIKKARGTITSSLKNNPSPEHLRRLKETLEQLELLQLQKLAKRMDVNLEPDRT